MTLEEWFNELDQYRERIPLNTLTAGLARVQMDLATVQPFVRFSLERYRRNLMRSGPAFHALVLCWRNGQGSPIHDHRGSACAVRVVSGEVTETRYEMTDDGQMFEGRKRLLTEGGVCATQDRDMHTLANHEPNGADLITLHIYSPPLVIMGQYSLDDASMIEFHDEVHSGGDGI